MSSRTQVINFAIAPYSDAVATQINALSEEQLYKLFDQPLSAEFLTAALFSISRREAHLREQLEDGNYNPSSDWILSDANQQCLSSGASFSLRVEPDILRGLKLAHLRDALLFANELNQLQIYPNVFLLIVDGIYAGHAYAWMKERVTNIVGLRSSLHQQLKGSCGLKTPYLTSVFLNAIDQWVRAVVLRSDLRSADLNQRDFYLRYLQPSGKLLSMLNRCGFRSIFSNRNDIAWAWFFDDETVGSTPLTEGLLFREYDYYIPLNSPQTCQAEPFQYQEVNRVGQA